MHFFISYFFLILFLRVQIFQALFYRNYEYTSAVRLKNYNSYYGNAKIQRYSIPSDVNQAQWYFQVRAAPTCPNTPVYIYLEYAGYPVVAPLNETFPSDFDLNRLTKTFTIIKVSGLSSSYGIQSANISINSPKSGNWYSAAFYINNDIENATSCSFYLASTTNIWINENVNVLSSNTPLPISGLSNLSNYNMLKYLTTSNSPLELNIKLNNDSNSCVVNAYIRQLALPIININANESIYDSYVTCNNSCVLSIQYPVKKTWYYITISSNCKFFILELNSDPESNTNILKTTRILGSNPYNTKYYLNPSNTYTLETDSTPNFFEYLFDHSTIGGTLNLRVSNRIAASTQLPNNLSVYFNGCLMFNSLDHYTDCSKGYKLKTRASLSDSSSSQLSIAYPMSGNWYLAMWQECLDSATNSNIECPQAYPVGATVQVSTDQCANNYCGDYGTCNVVAIGTNLISVCQCSNSYSGYACLASTITNVTIKYSSNNVGEVLFLTLSNLIFLAPIFLALDRRYFIEALIYSYAMFFSIFYHACGASSYNFCIFNYNGLQLADYIGAYGSFVITLLFIADLDRYWQLFGYFLGLLLCIALSLNDRTNTGSFIIILVIAGLITIGSWLNVWWQTGEVYPPQRQLIIYIPGLILAITGIILFLAVESGSNYWLTHSFWHMLIASSIVFFMPKAEENQEPLFKFVRELIYGESYNSNNNANAINSANMNNRSNGFF